MSDVKKARFVYYSLQERKYVYLNPDTATEEALRAETEGWYIHDECDYCYEDDDYNDKTEGHSVKDVPVAAMTSRSSSWRSSSDVIGDILVEGGHFVGVVLEVKEQGGSAWTSYDRKNDTILYTDGRVIGKPESFYSFSGPSSSKDTTDTYTLIKKDD